MVRTGVYAVTVRRIRGWDYPHRHLQEKLYMVPEVCHPPTRGRIVGSLLPYSRQKDRMETGSLVLRIKSVCDIR